MKKAGKKINDEKISAVTVFGLMTAIVTVLTLFISVPLPVSSEAAYLNAGDAAVYASAYLLGPWGGAAVSSVGSALADVLHGGMIYVPATLIIKGLMAMLCGLMLKKLRGGAAFIAGLVMPLGYFAYECALFGSPAALAGVWGNAVQYVFGSAAGCLLFAAFKRAGFTLFGRGKRGKGE